MSLQDILRKYDTGNKTGDNWFTLKTDCKGCMFDTGDAKHCLIYLEETGKEKPQNCKHRRTFEEGK